MVIAQAQNSMPSLTAERPDATAFWNVNVREEEQTIECPAFLRYCLDGSKDKDIIGTPDADYERLTWEEVREHVASDRPDLFQRTPSDLRKYRQFCHEIEARYGSVLTFLIKERLRWVDVLPSSNEDFRPGNYKILHNDWPYGIDKRIVHLIVWAKFTMQEDGETGLLVPEMRRKVDDFVEETFARRCVADSVVWFRNWTSLKSVHAIEHIHVMLFAPDPALIDRVTAEDFTLSVESGQIAPS